MLMLLAGCSHEPRWQTTHSGRSTIPAGQAFSELLLPSVDRRLRATLSEENDGAIVGFWLSPDEHERAQVGDTSEALRLAMERNTFLRGSGGDIVGETTVPQGQVYIYFEQDVGVSEPRALNIKYKFEVLR